MLLRPLSTMPWKNLSKLIVFIGILVLLPQTAMAEDQRLEAALKGLDAAMKRIDALESKVGKMSSLEAENKQLKSRIVKLETKQPPTKDTSQRKIASASQPEVIQPLAATAPIATQELKAKEIWQGAYFGFNAGYGANTMNRRDYSSYYPDGVYNSINDRAEYFAGPAVGLLAGYNEKITPNIVLGVETDGAWANVYNLLTNINTSSARTGWEWVWNYNPPWSSTTSPYVAVSKSYQRTGLDALGTTRFRLGYTFGNFMPYLTGGVAYGLVTDETRYGYASSSSTYFITQPYTENLNYKLRFSAGWAAGAGAEYMVADNWSTKLEYLYTAIGDARFYGGNTTFGTFGIHQARVGLNYHTDWLREQPVSLR